MILTTFFCLPANAFASESGEVGKIENPAYNGETVNYRARSLKSNNWMADQAREFADVLITRSTEYNFSIPSQSTLTRDQLQESVKQFFYYATDDSLSVSAVDGDYIRWQVAGYSFSYSYYNNCYNIDMTIYYYDNAKQNRQADEEIKAYLSSLDMDSYSDYELLKEFHDHILDICDYNKYNMEADYNSTAYGVFVVGKAVCQGYALAFYRLCKEAGFDVRFVSSDPEEGCHAWNLVRLGNEYYYVDTTWDDDNADPYQFFLVDYKTLQASDRNHEHLLFDELYSNNYFNNKYNQYVSQDCWDSTSADISNCTVNVDYSNPYNVSVFDDGRQLTYGTDYTVSQDNSCFVRIDGQGEYSGTHSERKDNIAYKPLNIESRAVEISSSIKKPYVSLSGLTYGKDYVVSYMFKASLGDTYAIAQGIGKYTGTQYADYSIVSGNINNVPISLSFTETYYNGEVQYPNVYVQGLKNRIDYKVRTVASKEPGTYCIYVDGMGSYTGTAALAYEIKRTPISTKSILVYNEVFFSDGTEKRPDVYVTGLKQGIDYTLSYSNNILPGTAVVTITGIGGYEGSVSYSYTIYPQTQPSASSSQSSDNKQKATQSSTSAKKVTKPKKVTLSKLKTSKKSITVYWKKVTCSGYQIQYSTSSNFKNAKTVTVKGSKTTSKKISKLK